MTESVAAVVVTYNRKELLAECLDALLRQTRPVQKIILIDNASSDGTSKFLRENGYLDNVQIDYVRLPENTGGAGGFYEGVKRGHEAGYDWLWLMDDDSEPKLNALQLMYENLPYENIAAFANLKVGEDGHPQYGHMGWFKICSLNNRAITPIDSSELTTELIDIDFASFVGLMVKSSAVNIIGLPKKEFFIHHDDVEYCSRLRRYGKILLVRDSVIVHKDGRNKRLVKHKSLGRESERITISNIWISYYSFRNLVWLKKNSCNIYPLAIFAMLTRRVAGIIVYDDHKLRRIRFYFKAALDGITGRFDNSFPVNYRT